MMRDINLWAYHTDFGLLCRHPAIDHSKGLSYPQGTEAGQVGWHVAVRFGTISELATTLAAGVPMPRQFCGNWLRDCEPVRRGEIGRLAIMAHGTQGGKVYINGKRSLRILTADTVAANHTDLHTIGLYTRESSTIIFMGCVAGQEYEGTRLLLALSRVWPGRRVVGFSTIGYRHPGAMKRVGALANCELPGMRDTSAFTEGQFIPPQFDALWKDFARMPWASERSTHAKVVRNGVMERCPPEEGHCERLVPRVTKASGGR